MTRKSHQLAWIISAALALASGCKEEEKTSESKEETPAETEEEVSGTLSIDNISDVSQLKISESFAIDIPESVAAQGPGIESQNGSIAVTALTQEQGSKSFEACRVRQEMFQAISELKGVGHDLCMIEANSDKIKLGIKYKLQFPEGTFDDEDNPEAGPQPSHMNLWVDNSQPERVTVYMCIGDTLERKFIVTGLNDQGAKGTYKFFGVGAKSKFAHEGFYDDKFSDPNRTKIIQNNVFSETIEAEGESSEPDIDTIHRKNVSLDLSEAGISAVKLSERILDKAVDGSFTRTMVLTTAARIGPNIGGLLFAETQEEETPDSGSSETPVFGKRFRSFFDNAGQLFKEEVSAAFQAGGKFHMTGKDLPKPLGAAFEVAAFGAGDWDCTGTEVEVDMSDSKGGEACEQKFDESYDDEDCEEALFAQGTEAEETLNFDEFQEIDPGNPVFDGGEEL
jgi:hypothetical protein